MPSAKEIKAARAEKQKQEAAGAEEATFKIKMDGVTYTLDFGDFSALDEVAFFTTMRKQVGEGMVFAQVFDGENVPPMFALAALLWLHRRHTEKGLTYEEVAAEFKMSSIEMDEDIEDVGVEEPSPED